MRKGVIEFAIFTSILLILLSSGIFAVPPAPGTCSIVIPNECVAAAGNYRIMGLSAATNAHAEFPYNGYPYVLCCGFNTTEGTTCTGSNKLLGLSSITNAHAEAPLLPPNYLTNVCYGDLQCRNSTSNCGATGSVVETYKLNFSSLSSVTNAHVGAINDFPIKICCKSAKYLSSCTIKSVGTSWNQVEAYEGVNVFLTVKGSGPECDGQRLDIEVIGATKMNATPVSFRNDTALSSWKEAEWQSAGILGGDKSYYFNATVAGVLSYAGKSMKSSNALTVRQMNTIDHCSTISSCEEYTDPNECNTDTPCDRANSEGTSQGVACDDCVTTCCSCSWNAGVCGFTWSVITSGLCNSSFTLCHSTLGVDYCGVSGCPGGEVPTSDGDSVCETGEGCSADCEGKQDSCILGATCVGGKCSGTTVPTNAEIRCAYGFTLCQVSGKNYCYPGNKCPTGQNPPSIGNPLKCDVGEGCLTTPDCKDGDQDSCISGTYCSLGKCASIQDPFAIGAAGECKITQIIEKDCDATDPYKIIRWTGEWSGIGDDPSNPAYQRCIAGGGARIPCPAQIQLPFFDYYSLIIVIGVIALIYVSLVFRRKFRKKKK